MDDIFILDDFIDIFSNKRFDLPVRWDGANYISTLSDLYDTYYESVSSLFFHNDAVRSVAPQVRNICDSILNAARIYLNGKPSEAFSLFNDLFHSVLMENQFTLYNTLYNPEDVSINKRVLFRARKVNDNRVYSRNELFHTPFNLRNKVSTTRYSIAGYPSLYLSSSLELCLEELDYEINPGRYICSRYEFVKESAAMIIDLGIKPTDFIINAKAITNSKRYKLIDKQLLTNPKTLRNYYLWYPLILACSFIRINRTDPFAIEYVIPQLLMQSVRLFVANQVFMGIRYFSCSSEYSSELGFNYVFPTNFTNGDELYCRLLSKSFFLTEPVFLNEFKGADECEIVLRNLKADSIDC